VDGNKRLEDWIRDLNDERAPVRCTAAYELGKIPDDEAVRALARVLKDEYLSVRRYAAESLGLIGNDGAVESLIEALDDENSDFQTTVTEALGKITNQVFSTSGEWKAWFDKIRS
jgi:HEAT repeat protein